MKCVLALICTLVFVAFTASAYTLPEEEVNFDEIFENHAKASAEEAILVGEILRDVARHLEDDDDIDDETDQYYFKALWEKAKSAVLNATEKVKVAVKGAYKEAKHHVKTAAKDAKKKAAEKVVEILAKIMSKFGQNYALEDSVSHVNIVKEVCAEISRVGQGLVEQGESVLESGN